MWLGEKITEKGIGNGMSMIIFAGIVAAIPNATINTFRLLETGELQIITLLVILIIVIAVTAGIVFVEAASRKIPIQYIKRGAVGLRGNVATSYLPLKLNTSGVIPIIFAASIISFPSTLASFSGNNYIKMLGFYLSPSHILYYVLYTALIIFFCYFYYFYNI